MKGGGAKVNVLLSLDIVYKNCGQDDRTEAPLFMFGLDSIQVTGVSECVSVSECEYVSVCVFGEGSTIGIVWTVVDNYSRY